VQRGDGGFLHAEQMRDYVVLCYAGGQLQIAVRYGSRRVTGVPVTVLDLP